MPGFLGSDCTRVLLSEHQSAPYQGRELVPTQKGKPELSAMQLEPRSCPESLGSLS